MIDRLELVPIDLDEANAFVAARHRHHVIAALYVATGGCYFGIPDVDPWDLERDARTYAGPHPVVAHPPCQRWGRYWSGGPSAKVRQKLGDDGGCFAAALSSVREWGGVLEHPEASHAWRAHGLIAPMRGGGWSVADDRGGWTCCVEQGAYGHPGQKPTWLYASRCELPVLRWASSSVHAGTDRKPSNGVIERLSKRQRAATPVAFRDVLLAVARSVSPAGARGAA